MFSSDQSISSKCYEHVEHYLEKFWNWAGESNTPRDSLLKMIIFDTLRRSRQLLDGLSKSSESEPTCEDTVLGFQAATTIGNLLGPHLHLTTWLNADDAGAFPLRYDDLIVRYPLGSSPAWISSPPSSTSDEGSLLVPCLNDVRLTEGKLTSEVGNYINRGWEEATQAETTRSVTLKTLSEKLQLLSRDLIKGMQELCKNDPNIPQATLVTTSAQLLTTVQGLSHVVCWLALEHNTLEEVPATIEGLMTLYPPDKVRHCAWPSLPRDRDGTGGKGTGNVEDSDMESVGVSPVSDLDSSDLDSLDEDLSG